MSKASSQQKGIRGAALASRWKGRDALDLIYRLNERTLTLLRTEATSAVDCKLPSLCRCSEVWSELTPQDLRRAARVPFAIIDVHFTNTTWWRQATESIDATGTSNQCLGCWPRRFTEPLMQETLILAWHSAKCDRRVARLSFGMSPAVADVIASLSPRQLTDISRRHSDDLRIRWQDNVNLWMHLLRSASIADERTLEEIHVHIKLRFCGELMPSA